jgi:hypothetical protein
MPIGDQEHAAQIAQHELRCQADTEHRDRDDERNRQREPKARQDARRPSHRIDPQRGQAFAGIERRPERLRQQISGQHEEHRHTKAAGLDEDAHPLHPAKIAVPAHALCQMVPEHNQASGGANEVGAGKPRVGHRSSHVF